MLHFTQIFTLWGVVGAATRSKSTDMADIPSGLNEMARLTGRRNPIRGFLMLFRQILYKEFIGG